MWECEAIAKFPTSTFFSCDSLIRPINYIGTHYGMWRSLVAHFVRDEGAAGSNPVIPIQVVRLSDSKTNVFSGTASRSKGRQD